MKKILFILLLLLESAMGHGLENKGKEPIQFILNKFETNEKIIIQTDKVKQQFDFINELIPILNTNGINVVVTFINPSDSIKLRQLIVYETFNDKLALELLKNYTINNINGYQEYYDLLKLGWQLNKTNRYFNMTAYNANYSTSGKQLIISDIELNKKYYTIRFHSAENKEINKEYNETVNKVFIVDSKDINIEQNCCGYLFINKTSKYEPLTWIDNFITEDYLPIVKNYFKHLSIETIQYATDLCIANNWTNFENKRL